MYWFFWGLITAFFLLTEVIANIHSCLSILINICECGKNLLTFLFNQKVSCGFFVVSDILYLVQHFFKVREWFNTTFDRGINILNQQKMPLLSSSIYPTRKARFWPRNLVLNCLFLTRNGICMILGNYVEYVEKCEIRHFRSIEEIRKFSVEWLSRRLPVAYATSYKFKKLNLISWTSVMTKNYLYNQRIFLSVDGQYL